MELANKHFPGCQKSFVMARFMAILLVFTGCVNQAERPADQPDENTKAVKFVFQEEFHNFGTLEAGEVVAYSFCVKNAGTKVLKIENAESDCGCITAEYPREEIIPGDSAYVEIIFNSAGETGKVYKEITIATNAADKNGTKLAIAAYVKNELLNIYN